ncbi:16S rRNA (cytidine(1402)-2'-O)-methyltransferase [Phaeovibrio sulfidiphilus]|uniref:Ribosomal RNA small subunit methyltransferase I n=1 Tax=Phaeovibrio sulfidiphilus TaxID=1220600 RepID=A0A8J7CQ77_9PROT|nr:16S rRNA (cytidine(1402)-2'-O)-methyltransferase [Phaeovibrio sulfidiphilus]MBE1236555.1 16S rRNA (cytidine(1402)-2'-O)-methyltransferase [Phaeovibrio sulfidiphilus]
MPPGLYVVGTPIGNMGDMTARAREYLARSHRIACEDTRVSGSLLKRLGLSGTLVPYHDHNADAQRPRILEWIRAGEAVALVSDAGMPLISDPGYKLVRDCREAGLYVTTAPGPSAVLTALALSGLPTDRFHFAGFPPTGGGKLARFCEELAGVPGTLVLFEGVSRLDRTFEALAVALGGQRQAALCRELTKLHEEVRRGTLEELAAFYREAGAPRGEAVIVVAPAEKGDGPDADTVDALLGAELAAGRSVRDAAAEVAGKTGQPRRALYQRALELERGDSDGDSDRTDPAR